jgi:hypothetical protein
MPLAHILAPQLARKAAEIAEQVQAVPPPSIRPGSTGMGYLSAPATPDPAVDAATKTGVAADKVLGRQGGNAFHKGTVEGMWPTQPAQPNNAVNIGAKKAKDFKESDEVTVPQNVIAHLQPTMGYLGKLAGGKFLHGMDYGYGAQALKDGPLRKAAGGDPNVAQMANAEREIAGKMPATPLGKLAPKGEIIIKLPPGAVGFSEDGQAVDKKGKKLGYLTDQAMRSAPREKPEINPSGNQHPDGISI